jgi:catechol 2,3-dioxygenase-like lactoylglutathione lyase family enzyme
MATSSPQAPAADLAIPTLPSRDLAATLRFYAALGFDGRIVGDGYAIVRRAALELHFFLHRSLNPARSDHGAYLRVARVDELYRALQAARLPQHGIPRMEVLADKPWGMREFAVLDADGNLLRIGQVLPDAG